MSVVPSPLESGPAPANLQTSILNGNLRIASSGGQGQQNAVYTVQGGPIISNVDLNLPVLSSDDTIATLSANNTWTGVHTFSQGFTATGPVNTASINATGPITTSGTILSLGGITSAGPMTAQGAFTAVGNFNAGNLITPGFLQVTGASTLTGTINASTTTNTGSLTVTGTHTVTGTQSVGGTSTFTGVTTHNAGATISSPLNVITVTGTSLHTITNTGTLLHQGNQMQVTPNNSNFTAGSGHLMLMNQTGGVNQQLFGVQCGNANGALILGTSTSQAIGFFKTGGQGSPQNSSHGAITAGGTYNTNVANMINDCYLALRNFGLLA